MEEIKQPVQTSQDAGTEQKQEEVSDKKTDQESSLDPQKVIELLDESDKALSAAEAKIVSMKREQRHKKSEREEDEESNVSEEDLTDRIDRRIKEVMSAGSQAHKDVELEEIQKTKKKTQELRASLLAKLTTSNSSMGSNQSKPQSEEDPLKDLSERDKQVLQRRASVLGMTLKEYAQKKLVKSL